MINIKNKLVLISVFLIFTVTNIFSQSVGKTGTTAAKFLSIGIGARANAMGGAFTSLPKDASSMYWNPAGIADIVNYQAIFTYTDRKSTRLNSSHIPLSRMPSSA